MKSKFKLKNVEEKIIRLVAFSVGSLNSFDNFSINLPNVTTQLHKRHRAFHKHNTALASSFKYFFGSLYA